MEIMRLPQTRYLLSRPTMVAIACSLTQVSPTAMTRHGSALARGTARLFTLRKSDNSGGLFEDVEFMHKTRKSYGNFVVRLAGERGLQTPV
jgi:hypothetical protein